MFLLDTNTVSELRKTKSGEPRVLMWAGSVPQSSLFLSVVTILELERGTLLIGRRDPAQGQLLRLWLDTLVFPAFEQRILTIDFEVARRCAALHVPRTRPERDALIAATALVHGMTVVTRNAADFQPMGVSVLNPWNAP